ncbi:hypothetical protein Agabi119p4_7326 [Agaricus bisporus var. burnettii]|uniref:Conidiation protein 6 n=2 Tax=Agaricus bisporus var. burnettii TaxID=192524 RepID=A0A8H7C7J4_AGABI|nr:hypothetical protein Agabi119p4_7326 [Agaricus bisporus var. burnettii]
MNQDKDETRVAAGLKATMHNPRTSDEAKESAQERLEEMGADVPSGGTQQTEASKETSDISGNVLRGHKATLSNPRTSERAKEHSEQVLEEHGAL